MPSQEYSIDFAHSNARTEMESGRVRQRRRFTASAQSISVVWSFSDLEFQLFESWAMHILGGANGWFETDILTGGGIVQQKVRIQNGQYSATYKAHMHWQVSATLDVESVNRLDSGVVSLLVALDNDLEGAGELITRIEQTVNYSDWSNT